MTSNKAASVKQRLLNLSRTRKENFSFLLERYMLERFLYRLGRSPYRESFLLKGAMLFSLWGNLPHRMTRDMDLLGIGSPQLDAVKQKVTDICAEAYDDDGLIFDASSIVVVPIREQNLYDGVRVSLFCFLGKAKMRLQIDVGFGDSIYPQPTHSIYPAILDDLDAPQIEAYRMETTIAEKFHAMTDLGIRNSRLKDYFDIAWLVEHFEFEFDQVRGAIVHTFERRGSSLPKQLPLGLTETFATDAQKNTQWRAFLKKTHAHQPKTLTETVDTIVCFLEPVIALLSQESENKMNWTSTEGWVKIERQQGEAE